MRPHRASRCAVAITWLLVAACAGQSRDTPLGTVDSAALHAADQAYVQAWLRDDTAAVLATLAPDAVLMPPGGRPLATMEAIQQFWWPRDGSHTRVTQYTTTVDELAGTGNLAYMRGTGRLSFVYEKDAQRVEQTSQTMALTVFSRMPDGHWRIQSRMWGPMAP